MPKVSVIIPTHNRAMLLKKAIQSVLDQSYTDFEIMVYDDASTDNTPQVVESFTDKRIKFTRHERNIGVNEVRNNAVINSNSDYIAFLDDDDEWLPTKLEKQIGVLEGSTDKLGAVYTGAYWIDMKLDKLVKTSVPRYRGNILKDLLMDNFITTASIIIKRPCFNKVGLFDSDCKYAEDFDMWIRIATEFDFDYVAEPLVKIYRNEISISMNYAVVINGLERLLTKHRELFAGDDKALGNHLFKLGIAYCYNGNTRLGRYNILKAIKLNPSDMRFYYNLLISIFGSDIFKFLKESKKSYLSFGPQN